MSTDLPESLLILSSFCSNLIMSPSSDNFISVVVLSKSRMSICLITKHIYLFIDSLYLIRISFMIFFSSLYMVPFSSLSIFKIIDLKSLSSESNVRASSGTVSFNCLLSCVWAILS